MFRTILTVVTTILILNAQSVFAQNYRYQAGYSQPRPSWSASLVDQKQHDFGVVPKASAQRHTFQFTNTLDSDLMLSGVRASCGCIKPKVLTPVVKPGENAELLIEFDTKNFDGVRSATATLSLQRTSPYREYSEIQFTIKGVIRRDVVVEPLAIEFGSMLVGNPTQRVITVKYAGNPQWQLVNVACSNSNIQLNVEETRRDVVARRVDYQITVTVPGDHPVGSFLDDLTLTTSDASNQILRVPISGHMKQPIQAAPIALGVIDRGEKIVKKLIINGERPFEISSIHATSPRLKFSESSGEKTLHVIEYSVDTSTDGEIVDQITIFTTDPNQSEIVVRFEAQVVPSTVVKGNGK
ncbi:MAG TPA: DUF1573 domain-containing protein [Pirellulaceae bacterium]|nr:DUF1573 domain-containing protein [Pirellulaceae bacterium]